MVKRRLNKTKSALGYSVEPGITGDFDEENLTRTRENISKSVVRQTGHVAGNRAQFVNPRQLSGNRAISVDPKSPKNETLAQPTLDSTIS